MLCLCVSFSNDVSCVQRWGSPLTLTLFFFQVSDDGTILTLQEVHVVEGAVRSGVVTDGGLLLMKTMAIQYSSGGLQR
jgi:hypothetical protein